MTNNEKPQFAMIPRGACNDRRLTASHHRLLGAIAYRDRGGFGGIGCWAGQKKLSEEANRGV